MNRGLTYKGSGVDIEAGNRFARRISGLARATRRAGVIGGIGGFGGLFALPKAYKEPVLVAGTDGVGTKLKIAFATGRHDTVGIDLVAMCVNDILTLGAEPLFFLDYFATGRLDRETGAAIIKGIAAACRQAACALLGGETAEMPSFYPPGEYDLAGFAVGVVERKRIIDGRKIRPGHVLVGLPSSGLHSNGYSLARKVLFETAGLSVGDRVPGLRRPLGDILLAPTRIYVRSVLPLVRRDVIHGIAHITGGGITENLPRILPRGCGAVVDRSAWTPQPVFRLIEEKGGVSRQEMFRVFNMGIGMILAVPPRSATLVLKALERTGERPSVIGEVVRGRRGVRYAG
ncbi:MAG: phosphoribosylformylglycinamidine cyclo-ligase [Nitrospirae bacterium RBG_16_64_22]|nr:MAG: phosphoribosylformylglycinamidine cyclo-ligase [Nitrospirae bacterium RBG_16_64_22]